MNKRMTRRFIVNSITGLNLSNPLRYERYYINDQLRIQKKNNKHEKEILKDNNVISKDEITLDEFNYLKSKSYKKIIRDSYLYLDDDRVSIKKYYELYDSLIRVEVEFLSYNEMEEYIKESWMGNEITDSSLAFDKDLSKLDREQFLIELNKYV